MLTLNDIIKTSSRPDIILSIIETMRINSQLLDTMVFVGINAGAVKLTRRLSFPTIQARNFNAAAVAESTAVFDNIIENIAIYTGRSEIDSASDVISGKTEETLLSQALQDLSVSMIKTVEKDLFQGTGASGDYIGVNSRLAVGPAEQLITTAVNGLQISLNVTNAKIFLMKLDEAIDSVFGTNEEKIIAMNRRTQRLMLAALRELNQQVFPTTDSLGRQVFLYGGCRIIIVENDSSNTLIIPNTETVDASNDCSSIYVFRWSSIDGMTMLIPNSANGVEPLKTNILSRMSGNQKSEVFLEGYYGLSFNRLDCASRLMGIRA